MKSTASRLRAQLPELVAEIRRGRVPAADRKLVLRAVERHWNAVAQLADLNTQKRARICRAILRAADLHLTVAFRAFTPRREWTGALWRYLERRHVHFGLQVRPSKRSIRKALTNEWTPPIGQALSTQYALSNISGGTDGRETDEHQGQRQRRRGEGAERPEGR